MADHFHDANRRRWDAASASWAHRADTRGIWKKCHLDPSLALYAAELRWLSDVAGKDVAVLGSGDNQVVFALAGMGAKVTSIDISERQLDVARSRAAALGLDIKFVQADVVDLSSLGNATFDLVYTGGYVAPWVSDLTRYYGEAARILKPDRLLIVSEYHPFRRVWSRSASDLKVGINYFDRGPHRFGPGWRVVSIMRRLVPKRCRPRETCSERSGRSTVPGCQASVAYVMRRSDKGDSSFASTRSRS
jgi:SAM-dependent methyltransferase